MGRKTREKGSNYVPVDYRNLLKELNENSKNKKRKRTTIDGFNNTRQRNYEME